MKQTNPLDKKHEIQNPKLFRMMSDNCINGGYKPSWIAGKTNGTGNYANTHSH